MNKLTTVFAMISVFLSDLFGGLDASIQCLLVFMIADWITGGILLPFVFKKSTKTETGTASSIVGFKGLVKKMCILLAVVIGHTADILLGVDVIRSAVIFGFCANELLSIIENLGIIGLPLPKALQNAVDALNERGNSYE